MAHKTEFVSVKNGYYVKPNGSLSDEKVQVIDNEGIRFLPNSERDGAGAVPLTHPVCHVTTDSADALTLADGADNQVLTVVLVGDSGNATLTPSNLAGGTSITLDDVGDTVTLYFDGTNWNVTGQNGITINA